MDARTMQVWNYLYSTSTLQYIVRTAVQLYSPHQKKEKRKSCTGSLCAHMHGSVLPVPVLCLRILPMVRHESISFGRLWVAINISKGFGRLWVAIDGTFYIYLSIRSDNLAPHGIGIPLARDPY